MRPIDLTSSVLLALVSALLAFVTTAYVVRGVPDANGAEGPASEAVAATEVVLPAPAIDPLGTQVAVADPSFVPADATPTEDDAPPVTIAFTGDIHGEPPIENVLVEGGNPLDGVASVLSEADVAVVNLETAIGTSGSPHGDTYDFQADPLLADRLADAGVDVANLANNHALDFGVEGADETVDLLDQAGVAAVGYGQDADEAYSPHIVDVGGRTVAILGISRVLPLREWEATATRPGAASAYDPAPAIQAVRDAAALADHVVVTIHWGQERHVCPNGDQVELARAFAQAGADVVAGHHPHVLQGIEEVGDDGTLVAYSLGNFVFYARTPATRQTGILTVTLGAGGVEGHRWQPAEIDGQGQPQLVDEQEPILGGETLTATATGPTCGPPSP